MCTAAIEQHVRKSFCYSAGLFKVKFVQTVDIFMTFREPIR